MFRTIILCFVALVFSCYANDTQINKVVYNQDGLLSENVEKKLNEISSELYKKTGIYTGVAVLNSLDMKPIEFIQSLNLKLPYAFLLLSKSVKAKDGSTHPLVDIYADPDTLSLFDKEQILSPFPETGTIIPILTSNKGKDIYNASILNGYADMVEQIANSKNIELKSAIGSANKNTLNIFRLLIYGLTFFTIFVLILRRIRVKK